MANTTMEPYKVDNDKLAFIYGIGDSSMILGQRLSELTGHAAALEIDMALSNIAMDLFGETRNFFQYGAELMGDGKTEDDLAFFRNEREIRNALITELPNRDFAFVIGRQFLYDHFHYLLLRGLKESSDQRIAEVAAKSIKEVTYHRDFSSEWIKRLGDGTEESHNRMQAALDELWQYTEELFYKTEADKKMIEQEVSFDYEDVKDEYYQNVKEILNEATLKIPEVKHFQKGGKEGVHTEHLGHILSEMQYLQRTYPGLEW